VNAATDRAMIVLTRKIPRLAKTTKKDAAMTMCIIITMKDVVMNNIITTMTKIAVIIIYIIIIQIVKDIIIVKMKS
jgi:hypothetical protein